MKKYRIVPIGEPKRYSQSLRRTSVSIEEACRVWYTMKRRGLHAAEIAKMERLLAKYVAPVAQGRNVRHLDDDFRIAVDDMLKKLHAPPESREIVIGMLRGAASDALRKGWIRYNPFLDRPPERPGEGKKYPALSAEEIHRLMAMDSRNPAYACLQVQLLTGIRPAEARGLCWEDIHEREGFILVRHQLRDGAASPVRRTKNYRTRKIHPSPQTFVILREMRDARENQKDQENPKELVFVDEHGNGLNGRRLNQLLRQTIGRDSVRLHDLRVTHATLMYRKTRDLHKVARRLGHAGMDVTRRHYVRVKPDLTRAREAQDQHYHFLRKPNPDHPMSG